MAFLVIHGFQGLIATSANLLTILAVCRFYYLRDNCACLFIASLGCADFLAGWAVISDIVIDNVSKQSSVFPYLCHMKIFLHYVLTLGNLYNILLVSIDRFLYIMRPLRYNSLVTNFHASIAIIVIWVVVLAQITIGLIKRPGHDNQICNMKESFNERSRSIAMAQVVIIVFLVLPCHGIQT